MKAVHDDARGTLLEEPRFEVALHRLTSYRDQEGVLSVYLDVDPATAQREGYEAALMDLWKPLVAGFTDRWLMGRLEYEIEAVTEEVRSWRQPPGRSVAMFFSGPGGIRTILPLQFPMRPLARFEPRPVLGPLISALDEHRRYAVVMFDKEEARLITIFLGAVEEETRIHAEVSIGRTDVGGWGGRLQNRYARHREHHLAEHVQSVIEHLWAVDRARPLHTIALAGPTEGLAALRRALPPALSRLVAGTLPVEMFASTSEVVQQVEALDARAREAEDRALVERIVGEAQAAGAAAVGWDETLQALAAGRVHLMALPAGASRPGVQCPAEHFLATSGNTCPLCGETLFATDDVVEAAIRTAAHTDSRVHFLAPAASRLLEERGAAALLRY